MKQADLNPLEYLQHQQSLQGALDEMEKNNSLSGVYVMEYRKHELARSGIYLSTETYIKSMERWKKSYVGTAKFARSFT